MSEPTTPKRGGKRRGAGRPPKVDGAAMGHTTITIDDMTRRRLLVLGDGNMSEGVRLAAEVAYNRYQATR